MAAGPTSVVCTMALLGTRTTSKASSMKTSTSAFIPGLSSPERLSSDTITGNIVTFCSTCAWGSIFSTEPVKVRSGNASTRTATSRPDERSPMSVSSTRVRTCMSPRSAMMNSAVPPDTFDEADWMTAPSSTFFWMIVPSIGARMLTSASCSSASSKSVRARTRDA